MTKLNNRKPDLHYLINRSVQNSIAGLNTAMPGIIENFDAEQKTCDVLPALKKEYRNGDIASLPLIQNVPVIFPQTSEAIISLPLKRGDTVLLIFSQRALDEWKKKGETVCPRDKRKHALTDAIAVPGIFPIGKGIAGNSDALKAQNGNFKLLGYTDGALEIENGIYELISVLNELCGEIKNFSQEIANITTIVMGAPVPPTNLAQLTLYITKFTAILNKLETFKR